ncbi:hypothetical protein AJ87_15140 [Rhizobium yanglingense]|nr:hypothetical protein AJ87_15140 [Rhizobium yanglingense]
MLKATNNVIESLDRAGHLQTDGIVTDAVTATPTGSAISMLSYLVCIGQPVRLPATRALIRLLKSRRQ